MHSFVYTSSEEGFIKGNNPNGSLSTKIPPTDPPDEVHPSTGVRYERSTTGSSLTTQTAEPEKVGMSGDNAGTVGPPRGAMTTSRPNLSTTSKRPLIQAGTVKSPKLDGSKLKTGDVQTSIINVTETPILNADFENGHLNAVKLRKKRNVCSQGYHKCLRSSEVYSSPLSQLDCTGGFTEDSDTRIDIRKEVEGLWQHSKYVPDLTTKAGVLPAYDQSSMCEALGFEKEISLVNKDWKNDDLDPTWSDVTMVNDLPFFHTFIPRASAAGVRFMCNSSQGKVRGLVLWMRYGVNIYSTDKQRAFTISVSKLKRRGDWSWIVLYDRVDCLPIYDSVVSSDCTMSVCIEAE